MVPLGRRHRNIFRHYLPILSDVHSQPRMVVPVDLPAVHDDELANRAS
jgi:hypothetical protein